MKLKVRGKSGIRILEAGYGENLLELLQKNGYSLGAYCGGNGRCAKCRVKINGEEKLACKSVVEKDIEIELIDEVGHYENKDDMSANISLGDRNDFAAALDIGTTTISLAVVNLSDMRIVSVKSCLNHQRAFGADVISRIDAALSGKDKLLQNAVQKDIITLLDRTFNELGIPAEKLSKIVISANTVMMHLFMGWDTSGMAAAPFKVESKDYAEYDFREIFGKVADYNPGLIILPALSAFIGADIISGLYALDMAEREDINAFIDLGTNAEMAVGNKNKIFVASAAAGPAFEGGNISMGMAGTEGAISEVRINPENKNLIIKTIGGGDAKGICGTGLISAVSEMLKNKIIDENGSLEENYLREGFTISENSTRCIRIKQEDIHNLILAKAAVASGLEILTAKSGNSLSDISNLYLAGSFAEYLNAEDAAAIGLIPPILSTKAKSSGNSSLRGAIKFLENPHSARMSLEKIISLSCPIELSEENSFGEKFIGKMNFIS